MKHYCVHCGQPIEINTASPGGTATCSACGKATYLPSAAEGAVPPVGAADGLHQYKSRFKGKDVAIGLGALLLLLLLVLLFMRPDQPARRWVFGELGPGPASENRSGTAAPAAPTDAQSGPGSSSTRQSSQTTPTSPDQVRPSTAGSGPAVPGSGSQPASDAAARSQEEMSSDQIPGLSGSGVAPADTGPARGGNLADVGSQAQQSAAGFPSTPDSIQKQADLEAGTPTGLTPGAGAGPGNNGPGNNANSAHGGNPANVGSQMQQPAAGLTLTPDSIQRQVDSEIRTTARSAPGAGTGLAENGSPQNIASGSPGRAASGLPVTTPANSTSPAQPPRPAVTNPGLPAQAVRPASAAVQPAARAATESTAEQANTGEVTGAGEPTIAMPAEVVKERTEDLLQVAQNDSQPVAPGDKQPAHDSPQMVPETNQGQPPPAASNPTDAMAAETASATEAAKTDDLGSNNNSKSEGHTPDASHPFEPQLGSNVVFVLDHSYSMRGDKSIVARRELVHTLDDLGTNKSFYILFFHSSGYEAMPAADPLPATPDNIHSMTNWIFSASHAFGSNPTKAMIRALEFEPDTIWLLSDGEFPVKVSKAIRHANDAVNAHIHTVGFYSRSGERILRQIADENGGTYRFVPPPDESRTSNRVPAADSKPADTQPPASP